VFDDTSYRYSYHGTIPSSIASILKYGLVPSGTTIGGQKVRERCGHFLGWGVYTTPCPLYAQLYAHPEPWRNYFVQTILMLRQPNTSITTSSDDGCATASIMGRTDIWRLYGGMLDSHEMQMRTTDFKSIVIQGILVKIHDRDPRTAGGEYHNLAQVLQRLSNE
jgi:hypothetical protein